MASNWHPVAQIQAVLRSLEFKMVQDGYRALVLAIEGDSKQTNMSMLLCLGTWALLIMRAIDVL